MKKLFISNENKSVRMFKYDWMDIFSRVHFSVPIFLFVPIITFLLYASFSSLALEAKKLIGLFTIGIFFWTIAEYMLHRFIFHYKPTSEIGKRLHFLMHGVHHDYPNDSKRLVMPPPISLPVGFVFFLLFKFLFGEYDSLPLFAGFLLGYLSYDMLHYAIHHTNWNNKWFMKLKAHHLKHHFKNPDMYFGVSTPFWDFILGTNKKS